MENPFCGNKFKRKLGQRFFIQESFQNWHMLHVYVDYASDKKLPHCMSLKKESTSFGRA